ncbi:MAG: aminoacyl-tRNA hydrolase [bacterium]|nr:aminoacyl-tRNA hydrolase [bacterium]
MLHVNDRLKIPLREFQFSFSRSSGPGGQNVNKVNTRVTLRWSIRDSPSLPPAVLRRFMQRYGRRVTQEGELIVTSQRFRDQGRNVADSLEKLREMLDSVATAPKSRKKTRPSRGAVERRLKEKRERSQRKRRRREPIDD